MFDYYRVDQILGVPETAWSFLGKLIPVGTFVLGIVVNRWLGRRDKRLKDKKALLDLLTEIDLLEGPVKKQAEVVDSFIADLRSAKDEVPKFTSYLHLKLDRLNMLDRSGIVDYLERSMGGRREALDVANALFLGCESLAFKHDQLQEVVNDYISKGTEIHERWRTEANVLLSIVAENMVEVEKLGKKVSDDPLMSTTVELTRRSLTAQEDILTVLEKMHEPLMEHLAKYRVDPRVKAIADANAKAAKIVMELQRERAYATTKLENVKESLITRYRELKQKSNELSAQS